MIKFGTSSRYYILENNENREVDSDDDEEGEGTKGGGEGDLKKLFQSLPKEQVIFLYVYYLLTYFKSDILLTCSAL